MGSPADYKYFVIEAPYEGIDEFVCIPWTWIVSRTGHDVVVSYPVENPSVTEQRVEYGEGISKEWKSYESVVRGAFYSYDQAKLIASKMNKLHHYQDCLNVECGLCAVLENESWGCLMKTIHSSERGAYSKQNIDKSLEFDVSSKSDDKSATKMELKRTPQSNLHAAAAKVVEPAESVNEVAEQLCQAFECPNGNSSLEPITITDPELFTVMLTSLRELHKSSNTNHSVMDIVLKTLNMNDKVMKEQAKLIVELRSALVSKGTTAVVEKTPKKKNKKQKVLDDEDDDHEVVNKKRYRPKIILPPEYNENDSRWTLKHHKLIPGLVELMPHTNVYINAIQLIHCKRLGKDCRSLARLLMPDIFTKNALKVCSLTGTRARAYDVKGAFVRPGLDEIARNAILDFVEEYGREKGWKIQENQSTLIKNGMRNLMKQIRAKYG